MILTGEFLDSQSSTNHRRGADGSNHSARRERVLPADAGGRDSNQKRRRAPKRTARAFCTSAIWPKVPVHGFEAEQG